MSEEKTNVIAGAGSEKGGLHPPLVRPSRRSGGRRQCGRHAGQGPGGGVQDPGDHSEIARKYYVFVIPVLKELDLKAAAKAVREKSIEMIKQAQLLPLTGYVHGGCSPVGMKKQFPTVFDQSVENLPAITVSAGKIGFQVETNPADLAALVRGSFAPVSK